MNRFFKLLLVLSVFLACEARSTSQSEVSAASAELQGRDPFADYLAADLPVADGFDFPVGGPDGTSPYRSLADGKRSRGWRVATGFGESYELGLHPGEDWNGRGGGDTDLGQPVTAVAAGRVVEAAEHPGPWGRIVMIDHLFYENAAKRIIRSVYVHLASMEVEAGQLVKRGQVIGTVGKDPEGRFWAHLHFELRWDLSLAPTFWPSSHEKELDWIAERYANPSQFLAAHRSLFVPQQEAALVLVDASEHRMRVYFGGRAHADYAISLGQEEGAKEVRGDLKTPVGMYFVVEKRKGAFGGDWGEYYGGHWMRVNYPNAFDADRGLEAGLITKVQHSAIAESWRARRATQRDTRLGGGIGFHGWLEEDWEDEGPRHLSWGCLVMHNEDIRALFDRLPLGTMVVIRE